MNIHSDEVKTKLTEEECAVLGKGETEAPYSGEYLNTTDKGVYTCKVCGTVLFSSENKLDSSKSALGLQGWPSFSDPAVAEHIGLRADDSLGMHRTEIYCKKCGGHLGHLFAASETGEDKDHYCVNSVCLDFKAEGTV